MLTDMTKEVEEKAEAERVAKELATIAEREVQVAEVEKKEAERLAAKEKEAEAEAEQSQRESQLPPPSPPRRPLHLSQKPNDVPLRSLRKTLSKATGLHGVLTPSSKTIQNQNARSTTRPSVGAPPARSEVKPVEISQGLAAADGDKNDAKDHPVLPRPAFYRQNQQ